MGFIINSNGAGYTTAAKVRQVYGFSQTTDISDADLNALIVYASRRLHRDVSTRKFNERLGGVIDGSQTTFPLPHGYIADRNLDSVVNTQDVTVYGVKQNPVDGTETRTTLTVSTIDPFEGKVTLSAAPSSSAYDWLEADYDTYGLPVYSDMMEAAASALAAHLVYVRVRDPSKTTFAGMRSGAVDPALADGKTIFSTSSRFIVEYGAIIQLIKSGAPRGGQDIQKPGRKETTWFRT